MAIRIKLMLGQNQYLVLSIFEVEIQLYPILSWYCLDHSRQGNNFLEHRRCILWRNVTLVEQASKIWLRRIIDSACRARERSGRARRARCGPCTITRIGHP